MKHPWLYFTAIFALVFITQISIWQVDTFTDNNLWTQRVVSLGTDLSHPRLHLDLKPYSEHPGLPTLLLAVGITKLNVSANLSLILSVALINAVTIGAIALAAYHLSPKTLAWLAIAGLVAFQPLFQHASPVDAVFGPLLVLIVLLIIKYGQAGQNISKSHDVWLSLTIGLALATRLHLAVLILPLPIFFLAKNIGWKRLVRIAGLSLIFGWLFITPLWLAPITFIKSLLNQGGFFTGSALTATVNHHVSWAIILYMPLAILSFFIAAIIYLKKIQLTIIKRSLLGILIVDTIFISILLLSAQLQSLRYFIPLIFLWEALLPLWLLPLWQQRQNSSLSPLISRLIPTSLIALLIAGQLFLLIYSLGFPDGT